jgi:hypothetical protein
MAILPIRADMPEKLAESPSACETAHWIQSLACWLQPMHNRETGTGPVAVPSLDDEKEVEFDWDQELRVS